MRVFKTAKSALSFIKRNLNTGNERTINDSIHFGVGSTVYAYSKDVIRAGYPVLRIDKNSAATFSHLLTDTAILAVIKETMIDGELIILD